MSISDKFYSVNGMKLIVDLQGLPEKTCDEMKRVTNSPFLTMKQKIKFLDVIRKNYLTDIEDKPKR